MKATALSTVRRYRRFAAWTPATWTFATGLATDVMLARLGTGTGQRLWSLGAFACAAAAVWLWARPTLRSTARWLDSKLRTQNRLEAVVEVAGRNDALARAVVAETGTFLAPKRLPLPYAGIAALATMTALLVRLFAVHDFQPPGTPPAPTEAVTRASAPVAETTQQPGTPSVAPRAEIRWLTPDADTEAHPMENIPLRAEAESGEGLQGVTLKLWVNGEARAPLAVTATPPSAFQAIDATLPLQDLGTDLPDVVLYHLSAQRTVPESTNGGASWPEVVSPLQVMRITPDREPVLGRADEELERQLIEVRQLRQGEVDVVRNAFALSHELTPRTEGAWRELIENSRTTAEGVRDRAAQLAQAEIPAAEKSLLARASASADEAARNLGAENAAAGFTPASRALVDLTACERAIEDRVMAARTRRAKEAAARKSEDGGVTLPMREQTPAGRLETLASSQAALSQTLATREIAADLFARQDRLSRDIAQLASEKKFGPEIDGLITSAGEQAREAAAQLNEGDTVAATEPATRAAQTLGEAVTRLDALSRARASAEIEAAQRAVLHEAIEIEFAGADTARAMRAASEQVRNVSAQLAADAVLEQEKGSADAARALAGLTNAFAPEPPNETAADRRERLTRLGRQAATANRHLNPREDDLKKAADELARAKARLEKKPTGEELKKAREQAEAAMQKIDAIAGEEGGKQPNPESDKGRGKAGAKEDKEAKAGSPKKSAGAAATAAGGGNGRSAGDNLDPAQAFTPNDALSRRIDGALRVADRTLREQKRAPSSRNSGSSSSSRWAGAPKPRSSGSSMRPPRSKRESRSRSSLAAPIPERPRPSPRSPQAALSMPFPSGPPMTRTRRGGRTGRPVKPVPGSWRRPARAPIARTSIRASST